jgi:replicative DNA helicase
MASTDIAFERGLPSNLDAERFVLGSILLDDSAYVQVAGVLEGDDFSLEKHRRIFTRMRELYDRGEKIDRVTVANELIRHGELESVDGVGYLVSLDDGLPQISNLDSYVRIVKDKALLRRLILTCQKVIDRSFVGVDEPDEILSGAEESILRLGEARINTGLANPAQIIQDFPEGVNAFLDPSRRLKGLSTGFVKLDEMTGGLHPGELFILAARPSMGKTALALNVAQHIAMHPDLKKTVAVFSLEMSKDSLLTRMLCSIARVDNRKYRAGYLNADERRQLQVAATQLMDAPIYIDDTSGINLMDIHAKLRRLRREQDLGLVVVDYLQLMSGRGKYENRNQEISSLSRGFKLLAKDLGIPMMVLSQLSRAPETRPGDHKPQLSDLRESGSIEQDADLVAFIYREEVYKPDRADLKGKADLLLAKQRNGPTGKVELVFLKEYTKFENRMADIGGGGEETPD